VEQEIISEFCCVEELPDGFTKIRSKNLDIIFKREFYESKMMNSPNFYYDGEIPTAEATVLQSSFIFDQMDLDEIPEFRPRDGSFTTSIGNDSGYSTSFQEVFPEQLQYPPIPLPPPPPQYLPYQTVDMSIPQPVPQFYLYAPGVNTLVPCEEIIISNTILSPEGPVYQSPTKAYVAYPMSGLDGHSFIRQPLIVPEPDISSSPPGHLPEEEEQETEGPELEEASKLEPSMSRKTPGVKPLPTDVPIVSNYIPGLPLQSLKTKKRRKKKSKSKLSACQTKVFLSSSDSEAKEVVLKDIELDQPDDGELFDFDSVEASDEIEIKLTDDLTNSLVNPPTEDDDIEDIKIAEDLINLIEAEPEFVDESPTNVCLSYSEAVRKEICLKPSVDEIEIPTEAGVEDPPENLSNVQNSKSKMKNKRPEVKIEVREEMESFFPAEQEMESKENQNCNNFELSDQVIEVNPTEAAGSNVPKDSEDEAPTREKEVGETIQEAPAMVRDVPHPPPEVSGRTRKGRRRKGRDKKDSSPLQRVLVVDDQVSVQYRPTGGPDGVVGGKVVSTLCDLLVIRELGHGMTRGVMDMERPFMGQYTPPDRQAYSDSSFVDQEQSPPLAELFSLD